MNTLVTLLVEPFAQYGFMRHALVACLALALGSGPIGVFLVLRRMSLVGDALSHAIMPGAALGFLAAGLSLPAMSLGGFLAGLAVALGSGVVTRLTRQGEDASFAAFYLISLALGVLIISLRGNNVDLMHVLFGTILAVDDQSLMLVALIASLTLTVVAVLYRPLIIECFDPGFLRATGGSGAIIHMIFLILAVLNLVSGFQALGTLMSVGMMILPATTSRFWVGEVWSLCLTSISIAFLSGYAGLVVSFHYNLPSGPAIILAAGLIYIFSFLFGRRSGLWQRLLPFSFS